jgi:hypothetical protein
MTLSSLSCGGKLTPAAGGRQPLRPPRLRAAPAVKRRHGEADRRRQEARGGDVRALANLRPQDRIYVSNAENDVSYGAPRRLEPDLAPASVLARVEPLEVTLTDYRESWAREMARMEAGS